MTKIKPHNELEYFTPDQFAECNDAIEFGSPLYIALWNKGVAKYEKMTSHIDLSHDWCPTSYQSEYNLASPEIWNVFSDDEKIAINNAMTNWR